MERDLLREHLAIRPRSTPTGASTPEPEESPSVDTEKDVGKDIQSETGDQSAPISSDIPTLPGVTVSCPNEADGKIVFIVGWKDGDPNNSKNGSMTGIWTTTVTCCILSAPMTIFTTSYMHVVFVYQGYAVSALGFMTFSRYFISGALTPASLKMYDSIGPHFSLIIVGIVAAVMAPVPFVLHKYSHKVRAMSKNAQVKGGMIAP